MASGARCAMSIWTVSSRFNDSYGTAMRGNEVLLGWARSLRSLCDPPKRLCKAHWAVDDSCLVLRTRIAVGAAAIDRRFPAVVQHSIVRSDLTSQPALGAPDRHGHGRHHGPFALPRSGYGATRTGHR